MVSKIYNWGAAIGMILLAIAVGADHLNLLTRGLATLAIILLAVEIIVDSLGEKNGN